MLLGIFAPALPAWHAAIEHGDGCSPHGTRGTASGNVLELEDHPRPPFDSEPSRVAADNEPSHGHPSQPVHHSSDDCITCWELSLARFAALTAPAALVCVGAVRDVALRPVPAPMVRMTALPVGSVRGPPRA